MMTHLSQSCLGYIKDPTVPTILVTLHVSKAAQALLPVGFRYALAGFTNISLAWWFDTGAMKPDVTIEGVVCCCHLAACGVSINRGAASH